MLYRSSQDVIRHILEQQGKFFCYAGAGVSVEAHQPIKTADSICNELRLRLLQAEGLDPDSDVERVSELDKRIDWDNKNLRYFSCVQNALPNQDSQVNYFRGLVERSRPGFVHHGIALLMRHGILKTTCLTTNFDKLLESAFTIQGELEAQAIRTNEEANFWEQDAAHRHYIVKLHGDYDTYNIVNTADETIKISESMSRIAGLLAEKSGAVVLGTAGYEESIRRLFNDFSDSVKKGKRTLSSGLFWAVYMGERDPGPISQQELERKMKARIESGVVSDAIVRMIERTNPINKLFSFFPLWNPAGDFVYRLINATGDQKALQGQARLYLDHYMRLWEVFRAKGLSPKVVDQHIQSLKKRSAYLDDPSEPIRRSVKPDLVCTSTVDQRADVCIYYGDITSRSFMDHEDFVSTRRAVVSPEDTFLSAGGGVALTLLKKAGEYKILNELSKFGHISQTDLAVTSGGNLPVHHILHAAAIEVTEKNGELHYSADPATVQETMTNILSVARALAIETLWVPLMGTGVANVNVADSLGAILQAIDAVGHDGADLTVLIFVYEEKLFARHDIGQTVQSILGDHTTVGSP